MNYTSDVVKCGTYSFHIGVLQVEPSTGKHSTHLVQTLVESDLPLIDKLPPEVLAEVFVHCIPTKEFCDTTHIMQTITSVCHKWRFMAMSTPSLWTQIYLHYSWKSPNIPIPLVACYLRRSKTLPLSIYITMSGTPNDSEYLNLLMTHASRWESLYIDSVCIPPALIAVQDQLTSLKSIRLSSSDPTIRDLSLLTSPVLTNVHITSRIIDPLPVLPYLQLTSLDLALSTCSLIQVRHILKKCFSLETLKIQRRAAGDNSTLGPHQFDLSFEPTCLPRLREFDFLASVDELVFLITALDLPALQSANISLNHSPDLLKIELLSLEIFFTLDLRHFRFDINLLNPKMEQPVDACRLLRRSPRLESFTTDSPDAFDFTKCVGSIIPSLSYLTITSRSSANHGVFNFLELIRPELKVGCSLKQVILKIAQGAFGQVSLVDEYVEELEKIASSCSFRVIHW